MTRLEMTLTVVSRQPQPLVPPAPAPGGGGGSDGSEERPPSSPRRRRRRMECECECISMTACTASLFLHDDQQQEQPQQDDERRNTIRNHAHPQQQQHQQDCIFLSSPLALSEILADDHEVELFSHAMETLLQKQELPSSSQQQQAAAAAAEFITCNLVFAIPSRSSRHDDRSSCPYQDRSPLQGHVFRSPMTAVHTAGPQHLACMVHLQLLDSPTDNDNNNNDDNQDCYYIRLTAVEYSRSHRSKLLRQEFGSWLLEEHMEKSVIATDAAGTVVFWNRFAQQLFQYTAAEAVGRNINQLTPTGMSLEQAVEIFSQLQQGHHWKGMFEVQRKDGSTLMAHVTDTPILDATGQLQFVVGVSADYSVLHNLMNQLECLNVELEHQVQLRTSELLEREKTLRMVGAAVQQSDTGVLIVTTATADDDDQDDDCRIEWANDAVLKLLGIPFNHDTSLEFSQRFQAPESTAGSSSQSGQEGGGMALDTAAFESASHKSNSSTTSSASSSSSSSSEAARRIFGLHPWDLPFLQLLPEGSTPHSDAGEKEGLDIKSFFTLSSSSSKHAETTALVRRRKVSSSSSPLSSPSRRETNMPPSSRGGAPGRRSNPKDPVHANTKQREPFKGEPEDKGHDNDDQEEPFEMVHLSITIQDLVDTKQKMIILRDLTAQVAAEKAQLAAEKAAAASRTKTEMMQMLSHEFRTPLQGIVGVASTMLMDMAPEEGMMFDNLSTILASSRLLLTLINNILDIGKMDADKMDEMELATIPVLPSVRDAITFCEPFAAINEVGLYLEECDSDSSTLLLQQQQWNVQDYTVQCHRLRLEQILINLISNGVKYTRPGTDVIVSIRQCTAAEAWLEATSAATSDFKVSAAAASDDSTGFMTTECTNDDDASCWKTQTDKMVTVISIRDHGAGISADEFQSVFGRYVQLRASREKDSKYGTTCHHHMVVGQSSGSGLGLALVLNFVRRMNGHIWINNSNHNNNNTKTLSKSGSRMSLRHNNNNGVNNDRRQQPNDTTTTGGGAIFSFCFPAGDPPDPPRLRESSNHSMVVDDGVATCNNRQQQPVELSPADAAKFRVVVVDDSMINLKVLQRMLLRLGVKQIKTCTSGRQALEYMESVIHGGMEEGPNLILSDIQMPGMNGYELMGHLRELPLRGEAPKVMACSADWTPETEWKCDEVGFDGVLRKPLTFSDLQNFLANTAADMFRPARTREHSNARWRHVDE